MSELERLHAALASRLQTGTMITSAVRRTGEGVWKSAAQLTRPSCPRAEGLFGQNQFPGMGLAQQIALAAMFNHYPSFAPNRCDC
jgi:hypothetical protein